MDNLTDEEKAVLVKLLKQRVVQMMIGTGEDWDLTEDEEYILWHIINRVTKGGN